jgi:hypothetical protein
LARVTSPVNTPPDEAAIQQIFQLTTGFMTSAALGVVAQLGVADHLADGPRSTPDLATRTGANEDALYRVLRALAMTGIFTETSSRTFALTPSGALLRSNVPGSVRDMVLWLCDSFHFRVYAEMAHSVRTGETLGDKLLGMPVFEYLQQNPELAARFNNAMTNFSAGIAPAVLEAYDFGGIDVLVDVAGGHGMLLASVRAQWIPADACRSHACAAVGGGSASTMRNVRNLVHVRAHSNRAVANEQMKRHRRSVVVSQV